jgi:hypothetical protein
MEQIQEPLLVTLKKSEEQFIKEEFDKFADVDYKKIFYNHPTQIKNINNNYKLKEKKENMENSGAGALINNNFPNGKNENEENDIQLLNKKRKQSEGLCELRTEMLEK